MDVPTTIAKEGLVELVVPDVPRNRGPGARSALPFYNPTMAIARDVSVLLSGRLVPRGGSVLDGLAATGALGLRIAGEAGGDLAVTLNDKNPRAVALIRENAGRNRLHVAVAEEDLNAHLGTHSYDFVEIDPFGSPVWFLDAALLSARRRFAVGASATDTAVLCGAKPAAAFRRYLARVRHTDAYAEIGTRVLLGYVARIAARFDRGVEPVLAFAAEHFVKAFLRVAEGGSRADAALSRLGWVRFDPAEGRHAEVAQGTEGAIGPLWMGPLIDPALLEAVHPRPYMGHGTGRLLDRLRGEAGLPPFYGENNAMTRRAGVSPPRLADVLEALRTEGHRAVRTHFRENAFKTDAPWDAVLEAYRRVPR